MLLHIFLGALVTCTLLLPLVLMLYAYHHAQSSITPFNYDSYLFVDEENQREYMDPDACILRNTEHAAQSVYMTLVVPAYNEQNRIRRMLKQTYEYCKKRYNESQSKGAPFTWEIIVVDDGSSDKTIQVVNQFIKEYYPSSAYKGINCIRLLPLVQNRGKGFAVKQGVLRARGERVLMLDADGASEISDMEKLEKALDAFRDKKERFTVALGSRRQSQSDAERHWFRDFISRVFNFLVQYISGVESIKDTQCGFKMFERPAARYLFINQHVERWCFDIDLLILCQFHTSPRISVCEIPIKWKEIEGSHLNIWGLLGILRDLFLIRLNYEVGLWDVKGTSQEKQSELNISGWDKLSKAEEIVYAS